ncbi:MAG: thrombospondin type 3 repeat-containing protein [Acidobacteriota bacterium]
MKRNSLASLALVAAVTLVAGAAYATMDLQKEFLKQYPDSKMKCGSCHTKAMPKKGEADVNKFGADMNKLKGKDGKYDFAALGKLDSDGDGVSNADELKKGTNPGDPASK